jgi:hypothetical protein
MSPNNKAVCTLRASMQGCVVSPTLSKDDLEEYVGWGGLTLNTVSFGHD